VKARRHRKILEIIHRQSVGTQAELAKMLRQAGFEVTQATVSRDVKELGLVKASDGQTMRYLPPGEQPVGLTEDRLRRLFRDYVWEVESNEILVVVKTLPGAAQGVASALDYARWPEILGTVAGDDTIFVAVRSRKQVAVLRNRLADLLEG
jgi:transcriptional regulator of arginine metabolism